MARVRQRTLLELQAGRRRAAFGPQQHDNNEKQAPQQNIEIRLHLPRLPSRAQVVARMRHARGMLKAARRHPWVVLALLGIAVILGALFGMKAVVGRWQADGKHGSGSSNATALQNRPPEQPTFATQLPEGKSIDDLGGWGRVSPSTSDPVFAFADSIGGVRITVSEQQLPANFRADPVGKVTALAKQFNATDPLSVSQGAVAFMGVGMKGQQSVVMYEHDLLILARSDEKLSKVQWESYLDHLQGN